MKPGLGNRIRHLRSALAPSPGLEAFDADEVRSKEGLAADGFRSLPPSSDTPPLRLRRVARRRSRALLGMRKILAEHGFVDRPGTRILDFGCSSGRTVRQWGPEEWAEVWGCEIDFTRTQWCRQNLGSRFRFVQTRERPPLPSRIGSLT